MPALLRTLLERRVPHALAIYAGASWALVEFVDFAVEEFLLSPHLTRVVLTGLLLLLPTVFLLAWFHGKPGRDREEMARTEKVGIPANLALCALVLWLLFGGKDLGAATTTLTVENEAGELVERVVPKTEFRKRTALFVLDAGAGLGEDHLWTTYAVPLAIEHDLMADDFFVAIPFSWLSWPLIEQGYADLRGAPLSLKREVARGEFAEFLAVGEIDRIDDRYRVSLTVHETRGGSVTGRSTHEGSDLLGLVDEMSVVMKTALGIPSREAVEDLPVRQRLTEDDAALEAFVAGVMRGRLDWDVDAAVDHLTRATTLDPTFTTAHRELSRWLRRADRRDDALTAIQAAMESLYRLPERARFQVRSEYYMLTGETDRVAGILDMWLELYPEDVSALEGRWQAQANQGDLEGALETLAEVRRLSPGHGRLLFDAAALSEELGRYDDAEAALTEFVDRYPDDPGGVLELSEFLRRRGEHEAARERLGRAALLHPLNNQLAFDLAELDLETGRFDDARRTYERWRDQARTVPEEAAALELLKRYHHFRGELQAALQQRSAWLEEFEGSPLSLRYQVSTALADVFLFLDAGRVAEAAAMLEVMEDGDDPYARDYFLPRARIHVLLESRGVEAAREAHRQAAEMRERNPSPGSAYLAGDLGVILERSGDDAAAADSYRRAIDLAGDFGRPLGRMRVDFRLGAGRTLRRLGRLDEAEAHLHQLLFRVPAHPHAHLELGLLYEARGDTEEAVEHLRSALATWENADATYEPARVARARLAALER